MFVHVSSVHNIGFKKFSVGSSIMISTFLISFDSLIAVAAELWGDFVIMNDTK